MIALQFATYELAKRRLPELERRASAGWDRWRPRLAPRRNAEPHVRTALG